MSFFRFWRYLPKKENNAIDDSLPRKIRRTWKRLKKQPEAIIRDWAQPVAGMPRSLVVVHYRLCHEQADGHLAETHGQHAN